MPKREPAKKRKYTVTETAEILGVPRDVVVALIHNADLPCIDLAPPGARHGRYMIGEEDLAILEQRRTYRPVGVNRTRCKRLYSQTMGAGGGEPKGARTDG